MENNPPNKTQSIYTHKITPLYYNTSYDYYDYYTFLNMAKNAI